MANSEELKTYSVNELSNFISMKLDGQVDSPDLIALKFNENKITGQVFLNLTQDDLREILPLIGERKIVKSLIDSFATSLVCKIFSMFLASV